MHYSVSIDVAYTGGVTCGQVEIGCDGLSALQQNFHPDNTPNAPTAPQFDLICVELRSNAP
jgi:hypothetical protein